MSVRLADGVIRLDGDCTVEDAETLLALLQQDPSALTDLQGCTRLHLAALQVLLAARRPIAGTPTDPFLRDHIAPILDRYRFERHATDSGRDVLWSSTARAACIPE